MTRRTLSLWWLLVLACFPAGWIVGQLPGGRPHAPGRVATPAGAARRAASSGEPSSPITANGPTGELSRWTTLDRALAESKQNGKPVMLDFNADWCPPCRMMKQQVFEAGGYGEAVLAAVIPVSIVDRRRENGMNPQETDELQRQYQIEAFPTLIVFSPRTGQSVKARGYRGALWTVWWIRKAAREVR